MLRTGTQRTTHHIDIDAPTGTVYGIIADAPAWPVHFAPTIHVERVEEADPREGGVERLRIWATANGEAKTWTSRRHLDPRRTRISFRQEVSTAPVASMSGEWIVEAGTAPGTARLTLLHEFTAVDDDPAGLAWIEQATDRNSGTELANIKALAEQATDTAGLVFEFEDSTVIDADPGAVYRFLHEAAAWPDRLPHVSRMTLREDVENIQWMVMDTVTKEGSSHTTESVRVCFPEQLRIVYKQIVTPPLMTAHLGEWTVVPTANGVRATSWHRVRLNEDAIAEVPQAGGTRASAAEFVRRAVGGNSAATLALAKSFAEARRD
ncbi:ribosome-associated toxin RatA of RatAB toxin-antitoxin module [Streptomyces canus]|uniref:aromatase/cyclase n=1 Tax=unclassified Streptomyces TaxID=2593676 RepID=UPI000F64676F|nr:aromatase/cyclase [Streptomyces sp. RP5T]RRR78791.1 cyclase [Streptomyces sp. RP5T]